MEETQITNAPQNKDSNKLLKILIIVVVVTAAAVAGWVVAKSLQKNPTPTEDETTAYMTNDHGVVCVSDGIEELKCEDLANEGAKTLKLPNKYKNTADIVQSPDGKKLLIVAGSNELSIADSNFNEVKNLSESIDKDALRAYAWAGNDSILVQEVKHEANDLAENPAPVIISSINIETGETKRLYKTGEQVESDSVKLIGANSEYLFVALPGAKNWVADEVDGPTDVINAIRLADGFVLQVNSNQVDIDSDGQKRFWTSTYYFDADRNYFYATGQARSDDAPDSLMVTASLTKNEYGLVMNKLAELPTDAVFDGYPTFTSKGLVLKNINEQGDTSYSLVNEAYEITVLNLKIEKNELNLHSGTLEMSFMGMPALSE